MSNPEGAVDGGRGRAGVFVIFGITGDLAKKMTFRSLYRLERRGLLDYPLIGVAADEWTVDQLMDRARSAIADTGEELDEDVFARFASRWSYLAGDVTTPEVYRRLGEEMARVRVQRRPGALFYLEMPPSLFGTIVEHLAQAGLTEGASIAVEKPFGHDLESARALNERLHRAVDEGQLLRVDHFLGKEPVIELEFMRFANLALSRLWDRDSVTCIQITLGETFGVEDRGHFYDPVGALRDVVQNHLMQVLALVTMDPPTGASDDDLRDKKSEVFRAMPAVLASEAVRGQYSGYRRIDGVADGSTTETFIALKLAIDNWRWEGVPVFIRAGKRLAATATEVRLFLRNTPRLPFLPGLDSAADNQVVLRIDPDAAMRLELVAYDDGTWKKVPLETAFARELGEPLEPYERLLHAALTGDHRLFARQDAVEETWRVLEPLIDAPPAVVEYAPGSWGPPEADDLVSGYPSWQEPWLGEPGLPD
ncbi:glucose-6-phosphate dehydrogenase [Tomitella fengzijianii]|uniref:Glucose-6-phosphate 1-dehydrogenase n=1 Tax=Tomitella fengzijianii TaxID=2597660 RepID=A0A516X691_9ACTN|nr:glucose-6-phosphate dehydrogenase [Tomitella fengzijianii]QDQ98594.1 glucose-6-phosphate dehydrogenase [Tomitella fengzijianii]